MKIFSNILRANKYGIDKIVSFTSHKQTKCWPKITYSYLYTCLLGLTYSIDFCSILFTQIFTSTKLVQFYVTKEHFDVLVNSFN